MTALPLLKLGSTRITVAGRSYVKERWLVSGVWVTFRCAVVLVEHSRVLRCILESSEVKSRSHAVLRITPTSRGAKLRARGAWGGDNGY